MSDRIDLSSEFLEPVSPRDNRILSSDLIISEANPTQSPSSITAPVELATRTLNAPSAPAPDATSRENSGLVRAEGVGDELSDGDDQNPNDSSGSGNGSGPEPDPSPAVERTEEAAQTSGIGGSGFATGKSAGGTGAGVANRLVIMRHNRSVRTPDPSLFRPMANLERRLKRSSLYDIGPPTPEPPPLAPADHEGAQSVRDTDTAAATFGQSPMRQSRVRDAIREESDASARESENAGNGGRRASKRVTICEVARAEPPEGPDAHNRADQRTPRTAGFIVPARFHLRASGVPPDTWPTHYPAYQPGTGDIIRRVQLKLRYGTRSISLRPDNRSGTQYLPWRVVEGATWGRSTIGWAGRSSHMPNSEKKLLPSASSTRPSETLQYLVDVRKDLIHAGQGL